MTQENSQTINRDLLILLGSISLCLCVYTLAGISFGLCLQAFFEGVYQSDVQYTISKETGGVLGFLLLLALPFIMAKYRATLLFLLGGLVISCCIASFAYMSQSTIVALISYAICGMMLANFSIVASTTLHHFIPESMRFTFQGILTACVSAMYVLAPLLTSWASHNRALLLGLLAVLCLVCLLPLFLIKQSTLFAPIPPKTVTFKTTFQTVLQKKSILFLMIASNLPGSLFGFIVFIGVKDSFSIKGSYGLDELYSLGAILVSIPLSHVAKNLGLQRILTLCIFSGAALFFSLIFVDGAHLATRFIFFTAGGFLTAIIALQTSYIGQSFKGPDLAAAMSAFSCVRYPVSIALAILLSAIVKFYEPSVTFIFMAVVLFLCGVAFLYYERKDIAST